MNCCARIPTGGLRKVRVDANEFADSGTDTMTAENEISIAGTTHAELDGLLAILQQEGRKRKPLIRRSIGLLGGFVSGVFLVIFLGIVLVAVSSHRPVRPLLPGVLLPLGIMLTFQALTGSPAQLQAGRKLVEIEDTRAVSMLLDIARWHDAELREKAQRMLLRLLPQLEIAEIRRWNRIQVLQLTRALRPDYADARTDYVLAILDLLERAGDPTVLPFVRALTRMPAGTEARVRVHEAATRCCAAIETRRPLGVAAIMPPQEAPPSSPPHPAHNIPRPNRPIRANDEPEAAGRKAKRRNLPLPPPS